MLETAQFIAVLSAVFLIVAVAAWAKLLLRPVLQPQVGSVAANVGNVEMASQLIVLAVGLSAVAAFLAVTSWFAT